MSVIVIGDAFVDIIVPIENVKPGGAYYRNIAMRAGGVANVAFQISKLGEEIKFVGKVGNDPFGKYFKEKLRDDGVKDLTSVDVRNPTGLCISLGYEDGERTMIANRGANDNLTFEDLENYTDEIEDAQIIYFSGYSLVKGKGKKCLLQMMERITEKNNRKCEIYFNPGAPNIINREFKEIINRYIDVLILNLDEAENLVREYSYERISEQLSKIAKIAVITKGGLGCTVVANGASIDVETKRMKTEDTTGAGDAFSAGFIIGRSRNLPLTKCAELGNRIAGDFLKKGVI